MALRLGLFLSLTGNIIAMCYTSPMRKSYQKLLKISPVESRIIARLERSPFKLTISGLASEIKLPRRTVGFNVASLYNRGIVKKETGGRYPLWYISNIAHEESNNVLVYSGIEQIQKKLWSLLHTPDLSRYYSIQGTESIQHQRMFYADNFNKSIHDFVKEKQIVVEGILSESGLKEINHLSLSQLQSHKDRLTVAYVVDDEILRFSHDLYVIDSKLCIVNYKKETLSIINDAAISSGVFSLIAMASSYGRKINLNTYIEQLILKK